MSKQVRWPIFGKMLSALLKEKGATLYRIGEDTELRAPNLSPVVKGKRRGTDEIIKILSDYLGVDYYQLQAWRLLDEYPSEAIAEAYKLWRKGLSDD